MNLLFVTISAVSLGILLFWGFRTLPREDWQVLACIPGRRILPGLYSATNLTYYGFFTATAQTFAMIYLCILMLSLERDVSLFSVLSVASFELPLAWGASKLIARIVEKRKNTFTVCGAFFVCVITTPWVIMGINSVFPDRSLPFMPLLAAGAIAYSMGEGVGRLACISFGCCYGKPLSQFSTRLQGLLEPWCLVFEGKTKKVAYEGGLDGQRLFPIQAITSVLYVVTAFVGAFLFLEARFSLAFVLTVAITQVWRSLSEVFRADHRGGGRVSVYQIMSAATVAYVFGVAVFAPPESPTVPNILAGLSRSWNPIVVIACQSAWIAAFLYMGRSKVTASVVSLHVREGTGNAR